VGRRAPQATRSPKCSRTSARRGDRINLVHARRIESAEAATIGAGEHQLIGSRPRIVAGKTADELVRLGAAARNGSLVAEIARRARRRLARHRDGIRRRRSDGRAIVRENERIHVHAHQTEATRVTDGPALNDHVRPVGIAHVDFDLARRAATITVRRIAVVATFTRIEHPIAA